MKISFKTLSFILFITLIFFVFPLHSWAEKEVSKRTKDIQILIDDDGQEIVVNVSTDDIKVRLLKGETVCFVEQQGEGERASYVF